MVDPREAGSAMPLRQVRQGDVALVLLAVGGNRQNKTRWSLLTRRGITAMITGWVITCYKCGAKIDDFSLADEWFCECGAHGIFEPPDDDDE